MFAHQRKLQSLVRVASRGVNPNHRLQSAPSAERDNRPAGGLRFQGCQSDVLLAGEQKSATTAVMVAHDIARLMAEKSDVARPSSQSAFFLTFANTHQRAPERVTGVHRQIDSMSSANGLTTR